MAGIGIEVIYAQLEGAFDGGNGFGFVAAIDEGRAHAQCSGLHSSAAHFASR